ncbi:MAG: ABC transporter permease [Bdellovibrionota bacterium]
MSGVWTVFRKEFRLYFNSPIAYILLALFTAFCAWWFFFFTPFFIIDQAETRYLFGVLPFVFLFLVPAVAMRLWAEEKKLGTIELLLTLPLRDGEIVLGKYLAALAFLAVALALTFTIPVSVAWLGDPDMGPIWGSYVGSLLLAGAYLAIGSFASAITRDQIIAFVVGLSCCTALYLVGIAASNSGILPASISHFLAFLGLSTHFESISRGVIDTRDVIYYLSVISFFLYLTALVLRRVRKG